MSNINCNFQDRNGRKKFGKKPQPIVKKKLLIGEGKDECNFFWVLLDYLKIDDVQIIEIGGNDFKKQLVYQKDRPDFDKADIIAITCDGDSNSHSKFQSMEHAIRKMGFNPPEKNGEYNNENPNVGLYIFPTPDDNSGMLEDLCLQTVETHESFQCVTTFSETIENLSEGPRNLSKAYVQVYLASRPGRSLAKDLGTGAKQGHWNLDSDSLDGLKFFLNVLK